MIEFILIAVFHWDMAYRNGNHTPTYLGTFKDEQACISARDIVAEKLKDDSIVFCAPTRSKSSR